MKLALIIVLAFFLRVWGLENNPPSLTWDEAAWGYNAYSLGIDGRDEFGKFLPIQYLESFGDFKPPLYAYLDILPVKIFGLNEFAVRFPSALFGVLTVLLTYLLVKAIFPKARQFSLFNFQFSIGEVAAFVLAISPWHINLSRAAFEANVATFFLITGVWLFLVSIHGRKWYLPFSVVSLILSMYTFNTARIVAPLLLLMLAVGFKKILLKRKKEMVITILVGLFLFAPLAQFLTSPQARLRFYEVNIFSDISIIEKTNQEITNDDNAWWSKILHNRRFAYSLEFLRHYFDHFNPAFLFIKGDGNPKFSTQDVGQLYLWDLPFLILGILLLFKRREGIWWIIPLWLLIGIIPAGTARETPHALRIEASLPTWQILIAIGIFGLLEYLRKIELKSSLKVLASCFVFSCLILNFIYYYHGYWTHYATEFSNEWQYGYKEAIYFVKEVQDRYNKIIFTDKLGRPYIYFLFYTKENPENFRQSAKIRREVFGFVHVDGYGKYRFDKDLNSDPAGERTLFIDTPEEVPSNALILKTFYLLDREQVLVAYTK